MNIKQGEPGVSNKPLGPVIQRMRAAARVAGRDAADIDLIAVSKTRSAEDIRPLLDAGHRIFGENRVQEAEEKWPGLRKDYDGIELHLIGQLQSNKAEDAVALFDMIHSLDRMSLVKALAKAMAMRDRHIPCLVQVNIGEEAQKGGCDIGAVPDLVKSARDRGLEIAGLMCIPPAEANPAPYFALLSKLSSENSLEKLSMGMSADFETAIKLGATHVRVGTALFGERK